MPDSSIATVTVVACPKCGKLDPGPRQICASCHSSGLEPRAVPATGKLVSWTMIRRPPTAFRHEGEYAVAVVTLTAGVQVTGRLRLDGGEPAPGAPVVGVDAAEGVPIFAVDASGANQ